MLKVILPSLIKINKTEKINNRDGNEMIKKLTTNKKIRTLSKFKNLGKIEKTDKTKNRKKPSFLTSKATLAFTKALILRHFNSKRYIQI